STNRVGFFKSVRMAVFLSRFWLGGRGGSVHLSVALAFLAQVLYPFAGFSQGLLRHLGAGLALGQAGVPFGLLGQPRGFFVVFLVHGDFRVLVLLAGLLHGHRGVAGGVGAFGVAQHGLGDRHLLLRRIAGAADQQGAGEGQQDKFWIECGASVDFHAFTS